jgi:hypothetical protein
VFLRTKDFMNILTRTSNESAVRIVKYTCMLLVAGASLADAQNSAVLNWVASPSPGVTGYDVYRGSTSGGPYTIQNPSIVTGTSYTDSTLQGGVPYYYVITAVDTLSNQSVYSNQVPAMSPALTALACNPTSISARAISNCTVTLSQAASSFGSSVTLSNTNIAALTIPASIGVAAGASSATFTATAGALAGNLNVVLTATLNGTSKSATLNLIAPAQGQSVSGTISPAAGGNGATVTLSGTSGTTTTTANTSGGYTFSGLANGTYTVTPNKTGYTFTPANLAVTIGGTNLTSVDFTAVQNQTSSAITVDAQVRLDQSTFSSNVSSPTFSTNSNNELLLAFVAAGQRSGFHTSVRSVSGAGLAWVLVVRTQTQRGTSEIWRAFSPALLSGVSVSAGLSRSVTSSMTVMSFAGVDPSGANGSGAIGAIGQGSGSSGAPTATLVTTRNGSLVVGAGNDPTNDLSRTPGDRKSVV